MSDLDVPDLLEEELRYRQQNLENTQKKILENHCKDLTPQQHEVFLKLSKQVEGESLVVSNYKKIRVIENIRDKHGFYSSLVSLDLPDDHQVQYSCEELGLVDINNELCIAPNKLIEITEKDRNMILEATKKVKTHVDKKGAYWMSVEKALAYNRIKMKYQRDEVIEMLKKKFKADDLDTVKIGGVTIFKNMSSSELDRFADLMKNVMKNDYNSPIFEIVDEFVKNQECKTLRDYCNYVEYVNKYVSDLKAKKEKVLQEEFEAEKEKGFSDMRKFDSERGITGKRKEFCMRQALNDFENNPEESFKNLEQNYTDLEVAVSPLNANIDPNFASVSSAVYHYYKHGRPFDKNHLTAKEYFDIASKLVNEPLNESSCQLNQQGDKNIINFADTKSGATAVVFETLEDGKRSLASVYYNSKVKRK